MFGNSICQLFFSLEQLAAIRKNVFQRLSKKITWKMMKKLLLWKASIIIVSRVAGTIFVTLFPYHANWILFIKNKIRNKEPYTELFQWVTTCSIIFSGLYDNSPRIMVVDGCSDHIRVPKLIATTWQPKSGYRTFVFIWRIRATGS